MGNEKSTHKNSFHATYEKQYKHDYMLTTRQKVQISQKIHSSLALESLAIERIRKESTGSVEERAK